MLFFRFAAALIDRPLWVMNVVPIDMPDTLSVIFDRGLIGIYHDWCESLSTYPRTYDLVHSSFLFKSFNQRYITVDTQHSYMSNIIFLLTMVTMLCPNFLSYCLEDIC